jgi:hypothetical protein
MAANTYDNIYVAGSFQGLVDFDPGYYTDSENAGNTTKHYLSRFYNTGDHDSVSSFGEIQNPISWRDPDICVDAAPNGYIYVAGRFDGMGKFGYGNYNSNGGFDAYIARFKSNTSLYWVRQIGGPGNDACQGIAIDDSSNIHASGYFHDTVDFDPGTDVMDYPSRGMDDSFLVKLMSDGYL